MSQALPQVINYSEPLYALPPNTESYQVVATPLSGSTFGENNIIECDLGSRGWLDPKSLFIRYKINVTPAGVTDMYMCGTPVYTPFLRLTTQINSQTTETINNYNVVANLLTNLSKDVGQKLGEQLAYGYLDTSQPVVTGNNNNAVDNEQTDGGTFSWVDGYRSKFLSAPLPCALSSCEKLVPLFLLQNIRLSFTIDSIANMFSLIDNAEAVCTRPTGISISNFELVYTVVDFGEEVKSMVSSMDRIRIKSQTFASSVQTLVQGVTGQQNLIYNHKYSSVKALFLNMGGGNRAVSANGNLDSYNIAKEGDYQFMIGQKAVPQRVLSAGNNFAGILQMLRQAIGSVYDKNNAMSINAREFGESDSGDVTIPIRPTKFWVGVSTEKLKVPGSFFTGLSTEASPISAIINISTATSQSHNVMLIVNADLIFEIDPQTKQLVIIQ